MLSSNPSVFFSGYGDTLILAVSLPRFLFLMDSEAERTRDTICLRRLQVSFDLVSMHLILQNSLSLFSLAWKNSPVVFFPPMNRRCPYFSIRSRACDILSASQGSLEYGNEPGAD